MTEESESLPKESHLARELKLCVKVRQTMANYFKICLFHSSFHVHFVGQRQERKREKDLKSKKSKKKGFQRKGDYYNNGKMKEDDLENNSKNEDEPMPLWESHYSSNFNSLVYFGAWHVDTDNKVKARLYRAYQVGSLIVTTSLIASFFVDLYSVFGDIKKTSWNICVNSLFTGAVMKLFLVYRKGSVVNDLRVKLHENMLSRKNEEDVAIQAATVQQLRSTRKFMYGCACSFGAVWQVSRYRSKYSEVKEMPIPLYIPQDVDLNIGFNFDMIFFSFSIIATMGLFFIVEQEMAMFSILLQIKREYDILLKDIPKLNAVNETGTQDGNGVEQKEINPDLQKKLTKSYLQELCIRQKTVMGYADAFEFCYNQPMVLQILVIMILSVSIGLQCIMFLNEYLAELAFQVGYLSIVLTDMYLLCFMGSTLTSLCGEVGHALYNTFWYAMDLDTQKDLSLMILTSQRPPRITSLKAIEVNLSAFMGIMKNVYSWLALFRQVAKKSAA